MNKLLVMGMALLSVLCFSACGHEDGPAEKIKGTYIVSRTITMDVPPEYMFEPQYHEVKLIIKAENENFVNITLPAASYVLNGQTMDMPSFTINNIPVLDDGMDGGVIRDHSFQQKAGKKDVVGSIDGEIEDDGDMELTVKFKYGSMPFSMTQKFKSL